MRDGRGPKKHKIQKIYREKMNMREELCKRQPS
jgi:hypothetical protein